MASGADGAGGEPPPSAFPLGYPRLPPSVTASICSTCCSPRVRGDPSSAAGAGAVEVAAATGTRRRAGRTTG